MLILYVNKNIHKSKIYIIKYILFTFIFLFHSLSYGDWWHQNSFLMGDRAAGLGGAFTGISSGPSGLYYNPGGLGFAPDLQLSLSTTNYYTSKITQSGYLGNSDSTFSLTDSDLLSGFFGGIIRFSTDTPMYFAFGIYNKDYVNLDNNIESVSSTNSSETNFNQKLSSTENEYAVAFALRAHDNFSIGLSLAFFDIKYSEIQTANIVAGPFPNPDSPGNNLYNYETWIYNSNFYISGIELGLGFLFKPNYYFSFGLSGKYKQILYQNGSTNFNDNTILTDESFNPLGPNSYAIPNGGSQGVNQITHTQYDKPFNSLPYMIRFGVGFYPAEFQTFSADVNYHSGADAQNIFYRLVPVYDFAVGSETVFFNTVALRLGVFTNNWCGDPNVTDQLVNVNFIGYTAGLVYINKANTYSLIYMLQQSQPGAYYALEPYYAQNNANPRVYWETQQFALSISDEL
ncbi:hypothetical protein [Silvanigrella aquatica]|uniref:Uncharacterized protein n=1 Tax=Silvanigrella aquatica TaxID=1915309 RepID=A0A1L4CZC2_9BACT|nr:hypothetical protein [Silvanigrella aquatica]APJ03304.1 hypothetical protein AXG55_05055 [Silvanigrella aquatica]